MRTACILTLSCVFLTEVSIANSKVKDCSPRQEVNLSSFRQSIQPSQISGLVLVGKKATYQVEGGGGKFKIISEQSFETGVNKIVCGGGKIAKDQNGFSMYIPTLLDLRKSADANISFWQFQITGNDSLFGIWNKKSRLLSQSKEAWDEILEKHGISFQIYQISNNLYEIHFQKYTEGTFEQLLVRYDAVTDL